MTDNIQKLYEIAGVEDIGKVESCSSEDYENCEYFWRFDCLKCEKAEKVQPPFTDTKQLDIIKWLAIKHSKYSILHIDKYCGCFRVCFDKDKTKDDAGYEFDYAGHNTDFSQALAGLVCELWDDLTDTQREEVRRILQ